MKTLIRVLIGAMLFLTVGDSFGQTEKYMDENVSFIYPEKWEKASSDIYDQLHQLLDQKLLNINRDIIELEILTSPKNKLNFLVFDKTKVPNYIIVESLLNERKEADNEALTTGYLTKINVLEIKNINGTLMLFEDFLANTGNYNGRTYLIRTVIKSIIYEFSISGIDNAGFESDKLYLDKVINSFTLN